MMEDLRSKMLAAKNEIQDKAGVEFRRETVALADLISEFVAIKLGGRVEPTQGQPLVTVKPQTASDPFYGE